MKVRVGMKKTNELIDFTPTWCKSFDDWRKKWDRMTDYAEKIGWIHSLTINDNCWEPQLTIPFLCSISDGYLLEHNFVAPGEEEKPGINVLRLRHEIALKALNVLCSNFFKDQSKWLWTVEHQSVRDAIVQFFWDENSLEVKNFARWDKENHQQTLLHKFLLDLVILGWHHAGKFKRYGWSFVKHDEVTKEMRALRPIFIEFLNHLGRLEWLLNQDLDTASLKKLKDIALRSDLTIPRESVDQQSIRKPKNLEQAALGGSGAARVLLLYRIQSSESERLSKLYEVSEELHNLKQQENRLKEKISQDVRAKFF